VAAKGGTTRRLSFLVGALDSLFVVGVTLGSLIAATTLVWALENNPSVAWLSSMRTALDIWFAGQGVSIHFAAGTLGGVDSPAFNLGLPPLGMLIVFVLLARRTAKKFATATELWPGWLGSILVYWLASAFLTPLASTPHAAPVAAQAAYLPALLYGSSVVLTSLFVKLPRGTEVARERLALKAWVERKAETAHWFLASLTGPALRAGTAFVVALLGVSALVIGVMLAANWISVIRLYEGLQATLIGGVALTLGQLVIAPNVMIYGASWLTGTGFSIGTGSHISPLGTELGPIPAFPIFGALPSGSFSSGMIVLVVPAIIAFVVTLGIKRHAADVRFNFANPLAAALSVGLGVGLVASAEMLLLGFFATGGIGPGRMQTFGVNPWMLALVTLLEVVPVSTLAAFYSAKPAASAPIPDHLKR